MSRLCLSFLLGSGFVLHDVAAGLNGFQLMNHNRQWKQQCDDLMLDLQAAKQELSEYQQLTEQKLQEEREKTNRAVVSTP